MNLAEYITDLASRGRYHFTTEEAAEAVGCSLVAARASIGRLRRKGNVAMPLRGFHVIVPPEYRRLGCLPPEQFIRQFMEHLGLSYYVGLLSAAELHGAAHQKSQISQVMAAANRPPVRCGKIRVQFVARHNLDDMPIVQRNTPRGVINASSAETTAFDLVGYARHAGGLQNVATILAALAATLKAEEFARIAPLSPVPWSQRLGWLLELIDASELAAPLAEHIARTATEYVPLNPKRAVNDSERSRRWKLFINDTVEPD
jgi:predicted transcriptional regulator of viral defense system